MSRDRPSWDVLYEIAYGQSGHFTIGQAADAGFSSQLVSAHAGGREQKNPSFCRVLRGVYRMSRYPPSEHEDLVAVWLWSGRQAVFSHATALDLHELSDVLPSRISFTLPTSASSRPVLPPGTVRHFAAIAPAEQQWFGPVPVTRPARTVCDFAGVHGDPLCVAQAIDQGIRRGLFSITQVAKAAQFL
jgi:predicted transcriptional regulator of viral defense system